MIYDKFQKKEDNCDEVFRDLGECLKECILAAEKKGSNKC